MIQALTCFVENSRSSRFQEETSNLYAMILVNHRSLFHISNLEQTVFTGSLNSDEVQLRNLGNSMSQVYLDYGLRDCIFDM